MCLPICVSSQPLVTSTRLAGCLKAPLSTTLVAQPMRWAVYRKRKHDGDGSRRGYGTTRILVKSGELMKLKKCAVGMGPWNQQL